MPTQPILEVLDRDRARTAPIIPLVTPLLEEVVNDATNVLRRCVPESGTLLPVDEAPFALYRHVAESVDAIAAMVSQRTTDQWFDRDVSPCLEGRLLAEAELLDERSPRLTTTTTLKRTGIAGLRPFGRIEAILAFVRATPVNA